MTDGENLIGRARLPELRRGTSYADDNIDKLSGGLVENANLTDQREGVFEQDIPETLHQAAGTIHEAQRAVTRTRTSSGSHGASQRTNPPSPDNGDHDWPLPSSSQNRGELPGRPAVTDRSLRRLSADSEKDVITTPRAATTRIRRQRPSAYIAPLADIQIMKVRSRAGSQVPSDPATPREAGPSTVSPAVAQRIAAGVSQAQAAMERRMASRRQSRQASRMSRRLSPRGSFAARGSPEVVQKNLLQAREALRRFEEAAAAGRSNELPSSASPFRAPSHTNIRRQSQSEPRAVQGSTEEEEQTFVAAVPSSGSREIRPWVENAQPHVSSSTHNEERSPSDKENMLSTAAGVPDEGRREPPVASSRRGSQGEKPARLDVHHAERVQSDVVQLAQLDQKRRASRIASRMASRPISRNPALLSTSAVSNRADVAKAAAEELRRRIAAEQLKVDFGAGTMELGASEQQRRSPRRRDQRETRFHVNRQLTPSDKKSPHGIETVSADNEDHMSSSDHAPRSTSSQEAPLLKAIVKSESGYSDSLIGRLISTLFPISSTASEAPSPRRSRRRSFVPVISPTPRSPGQTSLSSRNSPRLPEQQDASPLTQEATTDGRRTPTRARHLRPLRLGKFHEQLPRKALSAIYANSESLLRLCPQTEGSSSTSSAGTSSSGSHSGRPAGTLTVPQRRDGTFWESLPWRRQRHSEATPVSETFSDRRDAESTGSVADRRAPERRVGDAEDASSSRAASYYSSSGSLSPRYRPNEEARRFPIPVPVLDFSWLEKIATKRESRGLPPQPHLSRPVLHKKRASTDEFAKFSVRLRKQQLSILRESSLLATRRSAKSTKRVLSRRATIGTIGQREPDRCVGARDSSPHSIATTKTLNRSATSSMGNNERWSLDSLKGIKGAGRGRRRFYSKTAAAVGSRALNQSMAKKRGREILSSSSSLAFEPNEKFLPEKDDQSCVTPKSPLSWLSQDERRSRARGIHLDTDSDTGHAAVGNEVEEITSTHRTPRRRHSASSIQIEQVCTVRTTRHHMADERRDLRGLDGCSPGHSGSLVQSDLDHDSAIASLSSISACKELVLASSHQHFIEESAVFRRQDVRGKIVYTLFKKGSEKMSMREECDGLLIAVEPMRERCRCPEGREDGGRVLTVANNEESASDSRRERSTSAAWGLSPQKHMAVGIEGHNGCLSNVVSRGSSGDQLYAVETCARESVRQETELRFLRSGQRRSQSPGPTSDRMAKEDKVLSVDSQQSKSVHDLSRGEPLYTAAVMKQRRESFVEDKKVPGDRNGKRQESQQVTMNRQTMKKEHLKTLEQATNQLERSSDYVTSSKTTVPKASSTPMRFLEKEATVNVRRSSRTGTTCTRRQFSRAEDEVHLEKISESETSFQLMKGLHQGAETDRDLAESAGKCVKDDVTRRYNDVALASETNSPAVIQAVQRECEIDVRQFSLEDVTLRNIFSISGVLSRSNDTFPSQAASPASSKAQEQVKESSDTAVDLSSSMASGVSQSAKVNSDAGTTSIAELPIPQVISGFDGTWPRENETAGVSRTVTRCEAQRYKEDIVLGEADPRYGIQETDKSPILQLQLFRELMISNSSIDAEQVEPQHPTFLMTKSTTCGDKETSDFVPERRDKGCLREKHLTLSPVREDKSLPGTLKKETAEGYRQEEAEQLSQHVKRSMTEIEKKTMVHDQKKFIEEHQQQPQLKMNAQTPAANDRFSPSSGDTLPDDMTGIVLSGSNFRETRCQDVGTQGLSKDGLIGRSSREASEVSGAADVVKRDRCRIIKNVLIESVVPVGGALATASKNSVFQSLQQKRSPKGQQEGNDRKLKQSQLFSGVGRKKGEHIQALEATVETGWRKITAEKGSRHGPEEPAKVDDDDNSNEKSFNEMPPGKVRDLVSPGPSVRGEHLPEEMKGIRPELATGELRRRSSDWKHQGEEESEGFFAPQSRSVRKNTQGWRREEQGASTEERSGSIADDLKPKAQKKRSEDQATPAALATLGTRDATPSCSPTAGGSLHVAVEGEKNHSVPSTSVSQVKSVRQLQVAEEADHRQQCREHSISCQDRVRPQREASEEQQRWEEGSAIWREMAKFSRKTATAVGSERRTAESSAVSSGASATSLRGICEHVETAQQSLSAEVGRVGNIAVLFRDNNKEVAAKQGGRIVPKRSEESKGEPQTFLLEETFSLTSTGEAAALKFPISEGDMLKSEGPTAKLHTGVLYGEMQNAAPNEILPPGAGAEKPVYTATALDDGPPSAGSRSSVNSREVWVAEGNFDEEFSDGERGDVDATASVALVTRTTYEDKEILVQARDRHQFTPEDAEEETDKVMATRAVSQAAKKCVSNIDVATTRGQTEENGTKERGAEASLEIPLFAADHFSASPLPPVSTGKEDERGKNVEGATAQQRPSVEPPGGKNSTVGTARETSGLEVASPLIQGSLKRPDSTAVSAVAGETYGEGHDNSRHSGREVPTTASLKIEDGATADSTGSSHDYRRQQWYLTQSLEELCRLSQLAAVSETTPQEPENGRQRAKSAVCGGELTFVGERMAGVAVDAFHQRAPGSQLQSASSTSAKIAEGEGTKSKLRQSRAGQNDDLNTSAALSQRITFENHSAKPAAQPSGNRESHVEKRMLSTSQVATPVKTAQARGAREQEESNMCPSHTDSKYMPDTVSAPLDLSFKEVRKGAAFDTEDHVLLDAVSRQRPLSQETDVVKRTQRIGKGDGPQQTAAVESYGREHHPAADVTIASDSSPLNGGATVRGRKEGASRASLGAAAGLREVVVENKSVDSPENSPKVTIVGDQQEGELVLGTTQHAHVLSPKLPLVADSSATTPQAVTGGLRANEQRRVGRAASAINQSGNGPSLFPTSNIIPLEASGQSPAGAWGVAAEIDIGKVRPVPIERALIGAADSKEETETGEPTSPALSIQMKANAAKLFFSGPSIEEGKRHRWRGVPVLETGDEMDRWDSTVCPSPPFSPRYIPPACPPSRPAVPPLNLYWLRDRRHGPVQKKRLKDLVKTLHADDVCQASPPQIAAVSLQADPPLQSDDDRKKADIVASLLVDDPVVDLDTDVRKHQPVLSCYDRPPPPCVASTRSYLLKTPLQTPWQCSLDLEKSPELKAPRGKHPPIFRRWDTAGEAVPAAPEKATSEASVSSRADDGDVRKHLPFASLFDNPKGSRSAGPIRQPVVLNALRRSNRSHEGGQPETSESPPSPVEATSADERQKEVVQVGASSGTLDAAKTKGFNYASSQSVFTRLQEDRLTTMALHDVIPLPQDMIHLQQAGKHEDEAAMIECPAKLPESCRDSVTTQRSATGTLGTSTVKVNMQRETSSLERCLSRDTDSLERFKDDSAVRSLSLSVEHPTTSSCAISTPITANECQKEKAPNRTEEPLPRQKHSARTRAQGGLPVSASSTRIRVKSEAKSENRERPHPSSAAEGTSSIVDDMSPPAGHTPSAPSACEVRAPQVSPRPVEEEAPWLHDSPRLPERSLEEKPAEETEAAWTPRSRIKTAGERFLKGRSLEDALVTGVKDNETSGEIVGHKHTKPSPAPVRILKGPGGGPTEARAKAHAAAENVFQLIKSARMLLRTNEAMGTRTPAAVADVGISQDGTHERVADLTKGALQAKGKRAAMRPQRPPAYLEKLDSYEGPEKERSVCASAVESKQLQVEGRAHSHENGRASDGLNEALAEFCHVEDAKSSAAERPARSEASAFSAAPLTTAKTPHSGERVGHAKFRSYSPARVLRKDSVVAERIQSYEEMALRRQRVRSNGMNSETPVASLRPKNKATKFAPTRGVQAGTVSVAAGTSIRDTQTKTDLLSRKSDSLEPASAVATPEAQTALKSAKGLTEASDTQDGIDPAVPGMSLGEGIEETTRPPSSSFSGESTVEARQVVAMRRPSSCFSAESDITVSSRQHEQPQGGKGCFAYSADHQLQSQPLSEAVRLEGEHLKAKTRRGADAFSQLEAGPSGRKIQKNEATPKERKRDEALFPSQTDVGGDGMVQSETQTPFFKAATLASSERPGNTSSPEKRRQLQRDAGAGGALPSTQLRAGNSEDVRRLPRRARLTHRSTQVTKLQETRASSRTERLDSQAEKRPASKESLDSIAPGSCIRRCSSPVLQARTLLAERRGVHRDPLRSTAVFIETPHTQTRHEGEVSRQPEEMQVLEEDGVAVNQSALLETSSARFNTSVNSGFADVGERASWISSTTSHDEDMKTNPAENTLERPEHPAFEVTSGRESNNSVSGIRRNILTSKRTAAATKSPVAPRPQDEKKLKTDRRIRTERLIASVARLKKVAGVPSSTLKKSAIVSIRDVIGGRSSTRDAEKEKSPKHGSGGFTSPLTEAAETSRTCRHGDSKTAPKDSSRRAPAHKRSKPMRPRTSVEVSGLSGMAPAAGAVRIQMPDRVSVRKAASPAAGAKRRASYHIIIPRARTVERSRGPGVSAGKVPRTRTRKCLSDSTAWKDRYYEEPPDSVEEAKAVFLQSWWKAVTVRKWIDAAKCVRNFESSTSSMPLPSRLGASLYGVRFEDIAFPCVTPVDQEGFPSLSFQEDSSAACISPRNYVLPGSRRKSFADAFFEVLAAENREKRARSSSATCSTSHPKVFLGRVESEPGCLRITQRLSQGNTSVTQTPTGACKGEHVRRCPVFERSVLPCDENVPEGTVKGSPKKGVTLESATSSTTRGARNPITENNLLPHMVAGTRQAGEGYQFHRGGNISRCRHGIDSSKNRTSLRRSPRSRASLTRGGTGGDWWREEEYQPNKDGPIEYVCPEEEELREVRTPQGPLLDGINREEAQASRKLPESPTDSIRGVENHNCDSNGASVSASPWNESQSRRSHEEFRSRRKGKQWLAGYGRDEKICKQTECPRHGVGIEDSKEERGPQQFKSEGQTSEQKDKCVPKMMRDLLSRSPKESHSTGTGTEQEQAACREKEYEGDTRAGEELLNTQNFVPGIIEGQKGSREATETSSCGPKGAGTDKVEAWDFAKVGARSVTEGSLVEQDVEVHTSLASGLQREEENTSGDADSCFQKATSAGNKNDVDDGEKTSHRGDYFRADKNHSDISELKTRSSKELSIERKKCREHEARLTPLECEHTRKEEDEPSEHNRQDVTCGSVQRAEEQTQSWGTESEAQHSAAREKTLHTSANHEESFPPHALHESLTAQHADQQSHHVRENDDDDFIVSFAPTPEKRMGTEQKNSSHSWTHDVTICEQWRSQMEQAPSGCRQGRTEVENMHSQPGLGGRAAVSANGVDTQNLFSEYTLDNADETGDADSVGMLLSKSHPASRAKVEQGKGDVAVEGCTNHPSFNALTNESLRERRPDPHNFGSTCNASVSDEEGFLTQLDDDEEDPFSQLVEAKKATLL